MKFSKLVFLVSLLSLMGISNVMAIDVFPIIKEIKQNTPRDNYITVQSSINSAALTQENDEKQGYEFVTLELFTIQNPGSEKEKLINELGKTEPELVFSPSRLIIPYGEAHKVRIMPVKPITHEKIYRLRVRPSYPETELTQNKIRFAIGYDVLLRYLPLGQHKQGMSITCEDNAWKLTATGNVRSEMKNIVIDGIKQESYINVYPQHPRHLKVKKDLVFEMEGRRHVYQHCRLNA